MCKPMKTEGGPEALRSLGKGPKAPRADPWKWASLALMLALSFWIFYALALRHASDISIHATWAAEGDFLQPRTFLRHGAHPLWHGLVAFVS